MISVAITIHLWHGALAKRKNMDNVEIGASGGLKFESQKSLKVRMQCKVGCVNHILLEGQTSNVSFVFSETPES